jgi:regulation of enolase protein 1 (concanavalin A-like superfamily)
VSFWEWLKMALATLSVRLDINPDGTGDTEYPTGTKPPGVGTASWGDLSALSAAIAQRTTGTAFSHNIRQYLTGTAAPAATLSLATVSGDNAAAEGWAISGDTLTHPGNNPGAGFFKLGATVASNTVFSDALSWAWVNPATDTLGPTVPTGLTGTPGVGGIVWSWDASSDPQDGLIAAAGVEEYDFELNGAVTVVPGVQGLSGALSVTNIGAVSPAPSAVQDGRNWTLTAAGLGIDTTADECGFLGRQVSGDCTVIAKIFSIAGTGTNFAPGGVMIRESAAAGAKYVALYQWLAAQNQGIQGKYRINTNGPRANLATVAGTTTPRWLKLDRAGDLFTLSYSTDGRAWVEMSTQTVPMAAVVQVGAFASAMQAGNVITVAVHELNINTAPRLTRSQTTSAATSARVRVRDLAGNVSDWSALSDAVSPITAVAKKWHPGHYIRTSTDQTITSADVAAVNASTHVKGAQVQVWWGTLEPTRGNYNLQLIRDLLNTLPSTKRLIIEVVDRTNDGNTPGGALPAYLATEPGGGGGWHVKGDGIGVAAKIWLEPIANRLIVLHQAIAAEFDTNPRVELVVVTKESSITGANTSPDFSKSALAAQLIRISQAVSAFYTHTNCIARTNFLKDFASQLIAGHNAAGVGHGGPDVPPEPHAETDGGEVWRGLNTDPANGTPIDYRGTLPCAYTAASIPYTTTGAKDTKPGGAGYTAAELYDHAQNKLRVTHLAWVRRESGSAQWTAHILPLILANPNTYTAVPTRYTAVDTT